jgi:hypothetical protein
MGANHTASSRGLAVTILLTSQFLSGCQAKNPDEASIVLSPGQSPGSIVENGKAYDRAALELNGAVAIVVPDTAKIERDGRPGYIEIYMEKSQSFGGHPAERTSIRDSRKHMGCVKKVEAGKLVVATYGEWDSNIEGGNFLTHLLIRVPADMKVEARKGLSGPIKYRRGGPPQTRDDGIEPGKHGWEIVPDEPDPRMTARTVASR